MHLGVSGGQASTVLLRRGPLNHLPNPLDLIRQGIAELEEQAERDVRMPMDTVEGAWDNSELRRKIKESSGLD